MVKTWNHIMALLRLIRWPNLLIMAAVQVLLRQCVISPLLHANNMVLQLPSGLMIVVVLATLLIAAGGYAINDYFDRRIDMVNKPQKVIVGKMIHPRHVMAYHLGFTFAGVLLGTYAAFRSGLLFLSLLFIMVSGILWFYSTTYKKQLLLGTFIIAILAALVPVIVILFELPLVLREYGSAASGIIRPLLTWVLGFSAFAFLLNLVREIVKDAEDFEGDRAFGKQTLPVVIGMMYTKAIVTGILLLVIASLLLAYFYFVPDVYTFLYFMVMLVLPLLVVTGMVIKSDSQKSFHLASMMLKSVMLAGMLYMVVVNILMNRFA